MIPVGYLTNYGNRLWGEKGVYYDYILAGNGLFIEASNTILTARVPVADCVIRGLAPLESKVTMLYGSIPQRLFDLALNEFLVTPDIESYVAVTASSGYDFYVPEQEKQGSKVVYNTGDRVILDIHSHGTMPAFFSPQDNTDDQGLRLYAVVGHLRGTPMVKFRIGVYGYFLPLAWKDIFDGSLLGAVED